MALVVGKAVRLGPRVLTAASAIRLQLRERCLCIDTLRSRVPESGYIVSPDWHRV